MHSIHRLACFILFTFLTSCIYAFPLDSSKDGPHFYIQMENRSEQNATISFQPVVGNVSLTPSLNDHTNLLAHQRSRQYGVVFNPLGKDDQFNIIFTGKKDCAFNVAFYAPYDPKITISGLGCFGGGYQVQGDTLILYITDIHVKNQ